MSPSPKNRLCRFSKAPFRQRRLYKPEKTFVFSRKVHKGNDASDSLSDYRRYCCTDNSPTNYNDKQGVKQHINTTCRHRKHKSHFGLLCCVKQTLEHALQDDCSLAGNHNAAVQNAFFEQIGSRLIIIATGRIISSPTGDMVIPIITV